MTDTKKFDSEDWIEDAVETLDKSSFQWILITVVGPQQFRIDSNVNQDLREMILSGEEDMNRVIKEVLEKQQE